MFLSLSILSIHSLTSSLQSTPFRVLGGGEGQSLKVSSHDRALVRMGLATALSIAIHNFPEGLATYIATVDDPAVGLTLAVAIAIHNIPEGLCVSIPIYYATGDRKKAFLWGLLSGITEPIGALFGWAVLSNSMSSQTPSLQGWPSWPSRSACSLYRCKTSLSI